MEDSKNSVNLKNLEGSKMNTEKQPLLATPEQDHRPIIRPDLRSSPVDVLVEVQEDDQKDESAESSFFNSSTEYEPSKHRTLEHPTSNLDTLIHLLKGNIGTGILAMPDAFKNAGLYVGLFGTLMLGAICTHCMHILVRCSHELCRRLQVPSLSFSEVCFASFETGPQGVKRYSHLARNLINLFLIVTQLGFCCVYFVFVAVNIQEIVSHYFIKLDTRVYLVLMLVPMVLLNLVKNLKFLTPISLLAAILTVSGLAISFYYMLHDLPNTDTVPKYSTWAKLPLYFGTAIYAFEGIGVVLPLENNMKTPEDFGGLTGVLNTGMVIVACLYTSVGFFGYLKFGDDVKGSITLNLGEDLLAELVRLMMAIAIFLSYTLQFYVPINIVGPWLRSKLAGRTNQAIGEYMLRIIIVLFTFVLACVVPNLGAVISLVGAISSSTLALIFPPIIEIITFWPKGLGKYNWMLWKDIGIMIFGILGFLFGSFTSIYQIIHPELQKD